MPQGPIPVTVVNTSATGNSWFVNETSGSDTTGNGSPVRPFASLDAALSASRANNNDAVYLIGSSHRTSTLNWAKDGVSLIGLTAPSNNNRARISQTGAAVFSPLVNVTAQGCSFVNLGTFHGFASATSQICWNELGGRNFYSGVQFLGGGNATAAAQTGMRSLVVGGSGENLFDGCTIGLNTIARSVANASLEFIGGTPRNIFRRPVFQAYASNSGVLHVLAGATSMDREQLFDEAVFLNSVDSAATTMAAAFAINASAGGACVLKNPTSFGATAIATAGPVVIVGVVSTANTSGIAIAAT